MFEETDGDNNPFHVTNVFTTRADGATPIPPMLGHSNPSSKDPMLTRRELDGICWEEDGVTATRVERNVSGIRVFVSTNGSMTRKHFPAFCKHFVAHLPKGYGVGGLPVILVFDGHTSRWSYSGLKYLLDHHVFCLCLPGHTSIWSQPNDGGPNASFTDALGDGIQLYRRTHRRLPGSGKLLAMRRCDFNHTFVNVWLSWRESQRQILVQTGGNSIVSAYASGGQDIRAALDGGATSLGQRCGNG